MKDIEKYTNNMFESIKHIDEEGNEFWFARELKEIMEYVEWRKFEKVIDKAKESCRNTDNTVFDHFVGADKIVEAGATSKNIRDIKLSRYACYLIAQNGDSRKKAIALAQTYFAIKTRKQELSELEFLDLDETEKRFYVRKQTKDKNLILYQVAKNAGVKNYDKFTNAGYKGLYNGETADDIAKRKGLRYREEILDNMGSDELAANLFRITQTGQKITNQNIKGEKNATDAHFEVGKVIRETISKLGGTMPEKLETPSKSLKQIEKENKEKSKKIVMK